MLLSTMRPLLFVIILCALELQRCTAGLRQLGQPGAEEEEQDVRKLAKAKNLFEMGGMLLTYEQVAQHLGCAFVHELVEKGTLTRPANDPCTADESRIQNAPLADDFNWPRKNGFIEVPYQISNAFTSSNKDSIKTHIDTLAEATGIVKFVERTTESNYIDVIDDSGCWSYVGKIGGAQPLSLKQNGCLVTGIIQHEFLHALGFWHEHTHPDRDDYVTVYFENISSGYEGNFQKRIDDEVTDPTITAGYDYGSVMHYGRYAFSKNGNPTILPLDNSASIGQRAGPSDMDVMRVRLAYQCSSARTLAQFEATPCSSSCQCWEGAQGCGTNDEACIGELVCSNNVCGQGDPSPVSPSPTPSPTLSPTPAPITPTPSPTPAPTPSPPPVCLELTDSCTSSDTCCGTMACFVGSSDTGTCKNCKRPNKRCKYDHECCDSRFCVENKKGIKKCRTQAAPACKDHNKRCADDLQCCDGLVCVENKKGVNKCL